MAIRRPTLLAPILRLAAILAVALPISLPAPTAAGTSTGLNIVMTADDDVIAAGELAAFTIVVWNAGPDPIPGVQLNDDLPIRVDVGIWRLEIEGRDNIDRCGFASSAKPGGPLGASFYCELGDLPPSDMAGGIVLHVTGATDADSCGVLENAVWAEAPGVDRVHGDASIQVECLSASPVAEASPVAGAGPVAGAPVRGSVLSGNPAVGSVPDTALAKPGLRPVLWVGLLATVLAAAVGAATFGRAGRFVRSSS
jgi:uncharacterized repeat protein (TIGR01451 family)